jgi:hypothetical protein
MKLVPAKIVRPASALAEAAVADPAAVANVATAEVEEEAADTAIATKYN